MAHFRAPEFQFSTLTTIDTLTLYHISQNQQKLMHIEHIGRLKTLFRPLFDPNWPIFGLNNFFLENKALSLFSTNRRLTSCENLEQFYGWKYKNFCYWETDMPDFKGPACVQKSNAFIIYAILGPEYWTMRRLSGHTVFRSCSLGHELRDRSPT